LHHADADVQQAARRIVERSDSFAPVQAHIDALERAARASPKAPNDFLVLPIVGNGGEPIMMGTEYRLTLGNGRHRSGTIDAHGVIVAEKLPSGTYRVDLEPSRDIRGRKHYMVSVNQRTWRMIEAATPK
jgi:hypothetical protein